VSLVLASQEHAADVPAGVDVLVVDGLATSAPAPAWAPAAIHPRQLAYVLFTSGSTGEPKGCLIDHGSLAAYLHWARATYAPDGAAVDAAWFSPLTFDLTITSLFLPLLTGGTLRIADARARVADLPALAIQDVTLAKLTPSHLSLLAAQPVDASRLRTAVVGGEALTRDQLSALALAAPAARVFNEYGPTEATVGCVVAEVRPTDDRLPIGRPVNHATVRVVDAAGALAGIGMPGELLVGGHALARGYLGRPDLTAERFIPDAWSPDPGARLYRTGDRVRWLEDGTLDFLGRTDSQIKIRGHRVEPGEIEAALEACAGIRRAAVIGRDDGAGVRLVAYVEAEPAIDTDDVHRTLATTLPAYMTPSSLVVLDALPITRHGKLDRRALPAPPRPASFGRAPASVAERTLAAIWRELLRLDAVGLDDNFFALGGDSILAMQVVAAARRANLVLDADAVFAHQSLERLARAARAERGPEAVAAPIAGRVAPTPAQSWFLSRNHARPQHFCQALALSLAERVRLDALTAALARVVEDHPSLALTARRDEDGWTLAIGEIRPAIAPALIDLSGERGDEAERAFTHLSSRLQASLDLTTGPMLAVAVARMADADRLVIAIHHLAVDGVSWRVLLEDLEAAYTAAGAGLTQTAAIGAGAQQRAGSRAPSSGSVRAPLQPRPEFVSIATWSEALAARAAQSELLAERPFWVEVAGRTSQVPIDDEAAPDLVRDEAVDTLSLDRDTTDRLLRAATRAYNTRVDDLLLAALLLTLGDRSAGGLRIDLEGHGRTALGPGLDPSRTVGWLTTIYPVWLPLPDQATHEAAILSVKERLRRVPGQGLGYGLLRYLHPDAATRASVAGVPAPVLFNYHGQVEAGVTGAGFITRIDEAPGGSRDLDMVRPHAFEITAAIGRDGLVVSWTWGRRRHRAESIAGLVVRLGRTLDALIAHCVAPGAGRATASDFPEAGLTQRELEDLEADLLG
jgi:amino acid adenylation domain-containing protein/non-ribosomal peptide synthase protein (TIGR01720 family)